MARCDFQLPIGQSYSEGPHLEYKESAYSGKASDIRQMLRDVTALANAEGGYLVMGHSRGLCQPSGGFVTH
ncbi:MAG: putative DNA binding domain-containing protein [Anaerolineae bacterium]|nr:putative DNA binding domain-containing protein [Anaerolineae bacterium]